MIVFRVDSRIVHGQTVNYWCSKYGISKIIIVNDELAKDSLKKMFFKIAISKEIDLEFVEVKESVNIEYKEDNNYMVVFKNIEDVTKYLQYEGKISELIVSNLGYGEGKRKITEGIFLNDKELEDIEVLQNNFGVNVGYKAMPD